MRRPLAATFPVTFTAALLLTGCGQQVEERSGASGSSGSSDSPGAAWRDCTAAAFESSTGPAVEVPTDRGAATVRLPDRGACAGGLVARVGDTVSGLDVRALDLDPSTARVVRLAGSADPPALLRVDGGAHPRGGFQPHLFLVGDRVREVTVDGHPLLPFVATDGGMAPMTATCTDDGGVAVLMATTSEPPGVVLAWDVDRSTYDVSEAGAEPTGTEQVRDHVADPVLRRQTPALFEPGALFDNCSDR